MEKIHIEGDNDILDKIYTVRQYDFEERSSVNRMRLTTQLNAVTIEEIENMIRDSIEKQYQTQGLIEKLDKLVENYEIKMAYYMEQGYKQGFKDGVNLLKQCSEK